MIGGFGGGNWDVEWREDERMVGNLTPVMTLLSNYLSVGKYSQSIKQGLLRKPYPEEKKVS